MRNLLTVAQEILECSHATVPKVVPKRSATEVVQVCTDCGAWREVDKESGHPINSWVRPDRVEELVALAAGEVLATALGGPIEAHAPPALPGWSVAEAEVMSAIAFCKALSEPALQAGSVDAAAATLHGVRQAAQVRLSRALMRYAEAASAAEDLDAKGKG
jgi:hypothetical protein